MHYALLLTPLHSFQCGSALANLSSIGLMNPLCETMLAIHKSLNRPLDGGLLLDLACQHVIMTSCKCLHSCLRHVRVGEKGA